MSCRRLSLCCALLCCAVAPAASAAEVTLSIETPLPPPNWAVLQRELLRANAAACREFYARYFDERGYLECVERWGGDDGPDDAIENVNYWPILHALGAEDDILALYKRAWEGHLRQYTEAKTVDVPFARDGMYYKEFPVTFDWVHNGEGLTVFNLQGLSDPHDSRFQQRVRRFAGFYLNEDPGAPNYDPTYKIIRSMFNGSRGPLLRKATAVDWAGDPIEIENRFRPGHGERNYEEMLAHFQDYNDIVGDHPQNLQATSLGVNAFMLTGEEKYRDWVLEYVEAWRARTIANGGVIPTNVGLDGTIGGEAGGRWYGGVYGWGFTVLDPVTGQMVDRNRHAAALVGFGNALLLTGDQRYVDVWRQQIETINAQAKVIDGATMTPTMYGDDGWYSYKPAKYTEGALDVYYWSMDRADLDRLPLEGWIGYLEGQNPGYPEESLRRDFDALRRKVAAMRQDTTTPDTRLADDPIEFNPATVESLMQLTLGALPPERLGKVLHARLRYFDPLARRAGLPEDVAALIEKITDDEVTVTLVNVNQIEAREVVVQTGGYGEHQCLSVRHGVEEAAVDAPTFTVRLSPGAGERLNLRIKRYANPPTLLHPWDRR